MNNIIGNEYLRVEISGFGAEIQSVKSTEGTEYIWQGDPAYWKDRAINLFPLIGRLPDKKYQVNGDWYDMDIHGFLKDSEMSVVSDAGSDGNPDGLNMERPSILFQLCDSESTRQIYPFPFRLDLHYVLEDRTLVVCYTVFNTGKSPMYFGLGGHPGFGFPLEAGLSFEDYYLEFEDGCGPIQLETTETLFMSGHERGFPLRDGKFLDLRHSLFDKDAIILRNMGKAVSLKSRGGGRGVGLRFPDMQYLGLWHTPMTEAPFLCIEPWTSIPSTEEGVEALEDRRDLISLAPGLSYRNEWGITFF